MGLCLVRPCNPVLFLPLHTSTSFKHIKVYTQNKNTQMSFALWHVTSAGSWVVPQPTRAHPHVARDLQKNNDSTTSRAAGSSSGPEFMEQGAWSRPGSKEWYRTLKQSFQGRDGGERTPVSSVSVIFHVLPWNWRTAAKEIVLRRHFVPATTGKEQLCPCVTESVAATVAVSVAMEHSMHVRGLVDA